MNKQRKLTAAKVAKSPSPGFAIEAFGRSYPIRAGLGHLDHMEG